MALSKVLIDMVLIFLFMIKVIGMQINVIASIIMAVISMRKQILIQMTPQKNIGQI